MSISIYFKIFTDLLARAEDHPLSPLPLDLPSPPVLPNDDDHKVNLY
jgi:hypothetical protein